MPYRIEEDRPDCAGFAVVKESDGDLMGCHRTRAQALAQLAALAIDDDDDDDMPTDDDENLANQVGMRSTPNADTVREILAQLEARRLN
jgi:flagellar basal body rod protein FlgC